MTDLINACCNATPLVRTALVLAMWATPVGIGLAVWALCDTLQEDIGGESP